MLPVGPTFHLNPGAFEPLVQRTLTELSGRLPDDYLDFMRHSNGGEGFLGGHYLRLDQLQDLAGLNRVFADIEDVRDVVWFGGNGGGEAFGFDWASNGVIVEGPMIGMERATLLRCADTFIEFLKSPTGFKE
jgi:hypothetical protein